MKKIGFWVHPNGKSRTIRPGFCWGGFVLPQAWALLEGNWRLWAISGIPSVLLQTSAELDSYCVRHTYLDSLTCSVINVVLPVAVPLVQVALMVIVGLYGKRWQVADLLKRGYSDHSRFYAVSLAKVPQTDRL